MATKMQSWWRDPSLVLYNKFYEPDEEVSQYMRENCQFIGVFFGAFRNKSTKHFIFYLNKFYRYIQQRDEPFDIIYVPLDEDEPECDYFVNSCMEEWLVVPWANQNLRRNVRNLYNVLTQPSLVVVRNDDEGTVVSYDGKTDLLECGYFALIEWKSMYKKILQDIKDGKIVKPKMKSIESAPNDAPLDNSADKPADNSPEKVSEKSAKKSAEKLTEKAPDNTTDKKSENISEKPTENSNEKLPDNSAQKLPDDSNETSSKKPADNSTEKPTENPAEKPIENSTDKPTENSTEKLPDNSNENPPDASTENPTDNPTEEPVNNPTEEPADNPTEELADNPTEELADNPTDEPADNSTEKPAGDSAEELPGN